MKKRVTRSISVILTLLTILSVIPFTGFVFVHKASAITTDECSVGDIITFGSYPQSRVTDNTTLAALDSLSKTWISCGYYSGTGDRSDGCMKPSDYTKFADISYNGSKYRAVTFSSYRPYYTGDENTGETYQFDNGYYTENVYYFEYEPLTWRVFDPSEGYVMCTKAIDSQPYNNYILYSDNGNDNSEDDCYGDVTKSYFASSWADSSLRVWLNNDFFNTAFTSAEKQQIGTSYLENKSRDLSLYDSTPTYDKIFLISYSDAVNCQYGFSASDSVYDEARQIKSTDYAQSQGCWKSTTKNYIGNSWWWLRSPFYSEIAAEVSSNGSAAFTEDVTSTHEGIVPAFKFNPKNECKIKSVSVDDVSLNYKETAKINPVIDAENGVNYTVSYKSSDSSIANVDAIGNVYGAKKWCRKTVEITCTVTDEFGNQLSDTCNVTVGFAWWQWIIVIVLFGCLWY